MNQRPSGQMPQRESRVIRARDGQGREPGAPDGGHTSDARSRMVIAAPVNPRRAGARRHPRSAGGGGASRRPPTNSAPAHRRGKRKKRSKARQKPLRNYFSHFLAQVKIEASRGQKTKIFRNFRKSEHRFGEPQLPRDL